MGTTMKSLNRGMRSRWTQVGHSETGRYGVHTAACIAWIVSFTAVSLTAVSVYCLRWLKISLMRSELWYVYVSTICCKVYCFQVSTGFDRTVQQLGHVSPLVTSHGHYWLNHLFSGHGPCRANLHKLSLTQLSSVNAVNKLMMNRWYS